MVHTLSPIATFVHLLKIPLYSLSNCGLIVSSMPYAHLTTSLISFLNHFPSSHSNDDGDAKVIISTLLFLLRIQSYKKSIALTIEIKIENMKSYYISLSDFNSFIGLTLCV
jgi:hypothetical protein